MSRKSIQIIALIVMAFGLLMFLASRTVPCLPINRLHLQRVTVIESPPYDSVGFLDTVAVSPDGNTLATLTDSTDSNLILALYDTNSGSVVQPVGDASIHASFSQDGRLLAGRLGGLVTIFDVEDGQVVNTLDGNPNGFWFVSDALVAQYIAPQEDGDAHRLELWQAEDAELVGMWELDINADLLTMQRVVMLADGSTLVAADGLGTLHIIDTLTDAIVQHDTGSAPLNSFQINAARDQAMTFNARTDEVTIWRIDDAEFEVLESFTAPEAVDAALHPTRDWVMTAGDRGPIEVWRINRGGAPRVTWCIPGPGALNIVGFSHTPEFDADGSVMALPFATHVVVYEVRGMD